MSISVIGNNYGYGYSNAGIKSKQYKAAEEQVLADVMSEEAMMTPELL